MEIMYPVGFSHEFLKSLIPPEILKLGISAEKEYIRKKTSSQSPLDTQKLIFLQISEIYQFPPNF